MSSTKSIDTFDELRGLCSKGRAKLIESLADVDENFADVVLAEESDEYDGISPDIIQKVFRLSYPSDFDKGFVSYIFLSAHHFAVIAIFLHKR